MKIYNGPVMWLAIGAVLGGGGVYSAGLMRANTAPIHVGDLRPADSALLTPADGAAPAPSKALAAHASPSLPATPAARAAVAAAPVPGAAPQAPRPAGDGLAVQADPALADQADERSGAFQANAAAPAAPNAALKPAASRPAALPASHLASTTGSIRYGLAGRSELMGRGAGPVYNLKAAGGGSGASDPNAIMKQVGTLVQGAEQQVDQTSMDDASKAALKQNLQTATAGIPAQ